MTTKTKKSAPVIEIEDEEEDLPEQTREETVSFKLLVVSTMGRQKSVYCTFGNISKISQIFTPSQKDQTLQLYTILLCIT